MSSLIGFLNMVLFYYYMLQISLTETAFSAKIQKIFYLKLSL